MTEEETLADDLEQINEQSDDPKIEQIHQSYVYGDIDEIELEEKLRLHFHPEKTLSITDQRVSETENERSPSHAVRIFGAVAIAVSSFVYAISGLFSDFRSKVSRSYRGIEWTTRFVITGIFILTLIAIWDSIIPFATTLRHGNPIGTYELLKLGQGMLVLLLGGSFAAILYLFTK